MDKNLISELKNMAKEKVTAIKVNSKRSYAKRIPVDVKESLNLVDGVDDEVTTISDDEELREAFAEDSKEMCPEKRVWLDEHIDLDSNAEYMNTICDLLKSLSDDDFKAVVKAAKLIRKAEKAIKGGE